MATETAEAAGTLPPLIQSLRLSARLSKSKRRKGSGVQRSVGSKVPEESTASWALVLSEQKEPQEELQDVLLQDVFRPRDHVLDLGGAGLGDHAAMAVAADWVRLQQLGLERLHLGGNDISDAGLTVLATAVKDAPSGKLRRLNLRGNNLSPAAAEALLSMLPCMPRLESLDLVANDLDAETASVLQAAAAARRQTSAVWTTIWQQKGYLADRLQRPVDVKDIPGCAPKQVDRVFV
ncbi:Nlrc3 [Symbiodinium natans]|uniref:Nlrc3 protein n=1 Tax=Symbiodinium natans TaxID=878477 RepID=A0A812JED3_9DINO|nr:Nlrc3 [Symbiodinium natans]